MRPKIIAPLLSLAQRYRHDERGNIAVIFTIAVMPVLLAIGAAVDYAKATNARTAMQAALDTTALMISKDAASMTAAQITAKAQAYFAALYNHPQAAGVTVTAVYTPNTGKGATIDMTGAANVTTDFMKVAGYSTIPFNVNATATWGNTKLRVALALDVTGSMASDGKIGAMKTAAKDLVDVLRSSAKATEDVYISVIPFAQMVNVGKANKSATWIDWTDWDEVNGKCSNSWYKSKTSCTNAGKNWNTDNHNKWDGCVTDRDQNYDTTRTTPVTATPSTLFPAVQYEDYYGNNICSAQVLPMTSAYSSTNADIIKDKIDDLQPAGGTNQPIGMAWAWQTLSLAGPIPQPAKDVNVNYTDAIILLSDGLNTIDRWYGDGSNPSSQVDARQKILCDNIKDTTTNGKTVVYTIQVNTDGDAESAILKYCADAGSFYPTTTASGIATAFNQIGSSLSKLRISK